MAEWTGSYEFFPTGPLSDEEMRDSDCLVCESPTTAQYLIRDESIEHLGGAVTLCERCASLLEASDSAGLAARLSEPVADDLAFARRLIASGQRATPCATGPSGSHLEKGKLFEGDTETDEKEEAAERNLIHGS